MSNFNFAAKHLVITRKPDCIFTEDEKKMIPVRFFSGGVEESSISGGFYNLLEIVTLISKYYNICD